MYKIDVNKKSFLGNFNDKYVYLVHSYECLVDNKNDIAATYSLNKKRLYVQFKKTFLQHNFILRKAILMV